MTTSIFSESWIGIIFDGKNQQYGAYELRRSTNRNMVIAILLSVSMLSIGVNVLLLKYGQQGAIALIDKIHDKGEHIIDFVMQPPPPDVQITVPPSPPPPNKPLAATLQFAGLKIVDDNEVTLIDTVPAQQAFDNAEAGTETHLPPDDGPLALIDEIVPPAGDGEDKQKVHIRVEIMPEFPGGEGAMFKYLGNKTVYPEIARDNGLEGTVHVQFVVDRDGSLTDVMVAKGTFECLNDEALRVVKSMPKWRPGRQNGEAVKVRFVVPIRFVLSTDN